MHYGVASRRRIGQVEKKSYISNRSALLYLLHMKIPPKLETQNKVGNP